MFPRLYLYPDGNPIMSVNGSSEDGNCNLTSTARPRCREPTTSVLQDGNISTLTGLDDDMWASQLLTMNTSNSSIDITFIFRNITPSYDGLESVEVVMFNCPEWGISVDNITLLGSNNNSRIIENRLVDISLTYTSCASLVRVCISLSSQKLISSNLPVLTLSFQLSPDSTWVHLAEVTFYGAGPTCPSDTFYDDDSTCPSNAPETVTNTTTTEITTTSIADPILIIVPVVIVISIICIIVTLVIFLISVRYFSSRYKNNTSVNIALRKGHTTSHGQVMCEETGQVHYSTVQSNVDDPSDLMYAQVNKNSEKKTTKKKSIPSQVPEPHSPVEQLYAQVEKKGKKKKTKSTPQPEEPMDQLYAQVGKKKKITKKSTPHLDASIDQLYAQVDKKKASKKLESTPQLEEPSSSIDQLYAQVDKTNKKKARKKLESTSPLMRESFQQIDTQVDKGNTDVLNTDALSVEIGAAVYSVVNKPSPPQIPLKSDLLMEELN